MAMARDSGVAEDRMARAALGPTPETPISSLKLFSSFCGGEAVELEDVLPHVQVGVEPPPLALFQPGEGVLVVLQA